MTSDLDEAIDILRNWKGIMAGALVERINRLLARHPEPPKLLPCPCCGGKARRGHWSDDRIECTSCGLAITRRPEDVVPASLAVLQAWNRRTP